MIYFEDNHITLHQADVMDGLAQLPDESVQCVVTSPPYWGLRNYGWETVKLWGCWDDFCLPKKNIDRWFIRIRWRAQRPGGVWSRNKKSWVGALGLEPTPELYIEHLTQIFREVRRVLKKYGTLWLNMGDSYCSDRFTGCQGKNGQRANRNFTAEKMPPKLGNGLKPKDLVGIPWRVALALQADGWWFRCDIIWSKPNPMPESVTDRPTRAHEYLFLLTRSAQYFYDNDAIREPLADTSLLRLNQDIENQKGSLRANGGTRPDRPMKTVVKGGISAPGYDQAKKEKYNGTLARPPMTMVDRQYHELGRNKRTVWTVPAVGYPDAHFATFPPKLVEPCILAGSRVGDTVLDPFAGTGVSGEVAVKHQRKSILIELSPGSCKLSLKRFRQGTLNFNEAV